MLKKKEKTQKVTEAVLRSKSFELSLADIVKRSEKRAWFVAAISMILVIISGICVALILPLKQEVPYVVVADRDTGFSTVARLEGDFKNNKITASEAINKSNIAQYVIARESYDWELTNINGWGKVLSMSDGKVATDYKNQFLEDFPKNPNKIYGRAFSVRTKIRNITLAYTNGRQNDPTGATVNYDRYLFDKGKGTLQPLDRQMATLTFEYKPNLKMAEEYRYDNPLGFQVTNYQVETDNIAKPTIELPGNFPVISQQEGSMNSSQTDSMTTLSE